MQPFTLHLLRHGEPEQAGRLMGRTDAAPTAAGIEACVEQADGLGIEAIISSGLSRADRAAEAIGQVHQLPVAIDTRWRELDFGDWDGLAAASVDQTALGLFWNDPDENPPPNGERWSLLVARVAEALASLPAHNTLVVTHGGAMRAALARLCGFGQKQLWAFDLPCSSLLSLRVWPGDSLSAQIIGLRR